jgi:hypothetical protein
MRRQSVRYKTDAPTGIVVFFRINRLPAMAIIRDMGRIDTFI